MKKIILAAIAAAALAPASASADDAVAHPCPVVQPAIVFADCTHPDTGAHCAVWIYVGPTQFAAPDTRICLGPR